MLVILLVISTIVEDNFLVEFPSGLKEMSNLDSVR